MKIKKIETNYKKNILLKEQELDVRTYDYDKQENNLIFIYPDKEKQEILGFGGAVTESSGYVFSKFSDKVQDMFINEYFSEDGLKYNFIRMSIGSCDFSLKTRAYSEQEDLSDFTIEEDKKYILPLLNKINEKGNNINYLASPWSPPSFMKSNGKMSSEGKLKEEYYDLWAEYIKRFIEEYKKEKINIKYLTIQNEPEAKQIWESCLYNSDEEADFAINYLIPKIDKDIKVLCWDHNKDRLYSRAQEIFEKDRNNKIAGIGYHYYSGDHFNNVKLTREKYPNKLMIHTEGCTGIAFNRRARQVPNAEIYAHDIIGDLNNGTNAYIDWNILLDFKGGPNHVLNYCNSPIMANIFRNKYKKNACYYYIGHFSKYIEKGAKVIENSIFTDRLEVLSVKNPDGKIVVIVMNKSNKKDYFELVKDGKAICNKIAPHSIITFII